MKTFEEFMNESIKTSLPYKKGIMSYDYVKISNYKISIVEDWLDHGAFAIGITKPDYFKKIDINDALNNILIVLEDILKNNSNIFKNVTEIKLFIHPDNNFQKLSTDNKLLSFIKKHSLSIGDQNKSDEIVLKTELYKSRISDENELNNISNELNNIIDEFLKNKKIKFSKYNVNKWTNQISIKKNDKELNIEFKII